MFVVEGCDDGDEKFWEGSSDAEESESDDEGMDFAESGDIDGSSHGEFSGEKEEEDAGTEDENLGGHDARESLFFLWSWY